MTLSKLLLLLLLFLHHHNQSKAKNLLTANLFSVTLKAKLCIPKPHNDCYHKFPLANEHKKLHLKCNINAFNI